MESVAAHEQLLPRQLIDTLESIDGVIVYGAGPSRGGTVAFNYKDVHAHDVGTIVDQAGIAIRAGHHCCQPLMRHLEVDATARASVYLYTTPDEVSSLGNALQEVARVFG